MGPREMYIIKMNVLVRNLSRRVTEKELLDMFRPFGRVRALNLVLDKLTGKSKGFGFVDMPRDEEARAAIRALNGTLVRGEKVRVKKTKHAYSPPEKA